MLKVNLSAAAEDLDEYRAMVREQGPVRYPTLDELEQQARRAHRRRLLCVVRPEAPDASDPDPPAPER
jgi:hypothetical protein